MIFYIFRDFDDFMKQKLPLIIFSIILCVIFFIQVKPLHAAIGDTQVPAAGWVSDSEVTFVGKTAARSNDFINWALRNYQWIVVQQGASNPLIDFWVKIRNIVYAFFILFIPVTAFILIVSGGKSITFSRFIMRFIAGIMLVTFSFALIQFIYQIIDIIQGFFLKNTAGVIISSRDLLNVAFDYKSFVGFRLQGVSFDESAFISLLLIKITTITYYIMGGVLLVRKIILWFFISLSPIFPALFLYAPIRNTAKIWIGEFFRWLLYAPVFAILLSSLVSLWHIIIPLGFSFTSVGKPENIMYPTAVNILLGGPGQNVSLTNSINLPDTFALYVAALIMLWIVIILPFLLLQIFLDYFHSFSFRDNSVIQNIIGRGTSLFAKTPPFVPPPPPPPPVGYQPAAKAMPLPFSTQSSYAREPLKTFQSVKTTSTVGREILQLTNLTVPTMRDIANYETHILSSDVSRREQVNRLSQSLKNIENPMLVAQPQERARYVEARTKLHEASKLGDPVASSILNAASLTVQPAKPTVLPAINRVQSVNIEDYEAVKKLWTENYGNMEVPQSIDKGQQTRKEWIKGDINKITEAINLLSSGDPKKVQEAMKMVSNILPFLLIGGFSQTEILAYLKAKAEAGKNVLAEQEKRDDEEGTLVEVKKKEEEPKEMHMEALKDPLEEKAEKSNNNNNNE